MDPSLEDFNFGFEDVDFRFFNLDLGLVDNDIWLLEINNRLFEGDIDGFEPDDGLVDLDLVNAEVGLWMGNSKHSRVDEDLTQCDYHSAFAHAEVVRPNGELLGMRVNRAPEDCDFAAWGVIMDCQTLKLTGTTSILGSLKLTIGLGPERPLLDLQGDW